MLGLGQGLGSGLGLGLGLGIGIGIGFGLGLGLGLGLGPGFGVFHLPGAAAEERLVEQVVGQHALEAQRRLIALSIAVLGRDVRPAGLDACRSALQRRELRLDLVRVRVSGQGQGQG